MSSCGFVMCPREATARVSSSGRLTSETASMKPRETAHLHLRSPGRTLHAGPSGKEFTIWYCDLRPKYLLAAGGSRSANPTSERKPPWLLPTTPSPRKTGRSTTTRPTAQMGSASSPKTVDTGLMADHCARSVRRSATRDSRLPVTECHLPTRASRLAVDDVPEAPNRINGKAVL